MQTNDNPYQSKNILLFELIYGKHLISLGGLDAIENMFSDIDLHKLHALDIGFGLGGVAFYLAKKYQMHVHGIEVNNWMVEHAMQEAPQEIAHCLNFSSYDQDGLMPFARASFDLIYSKGVLNHVHDKNNLLSEAYRVLKANGTLIIADWIYSEASKENSSPLVHETQASYEQVLAESGFIDLNFRNDSKIFLNYTKKLLKNLSQNKQLIAKEFGVEICNVIFTEHAALIDDLNHERKFAVRIQARKT